MRLLEQARANPLAFWWVSLSVISGVNISIWLHLYGLTPHGGAANADAHLMLLLCAAYVFGCAFRSFLPRADVQRICLFDTWLSSILVGRSVATVAEVCFAAQWAILLHKLGSKAGIDITAGIAFAIVPLIVLAQCLSWYGVVTTNTLANAIENSIWAITFACTGFGLCLLVPEFDGSLRFALLVALVGIAAYLVFLVTIDVPMYMRRWRTGLANGQRHLALLDGLCEIATRRTVTRDFAHWKDEIAWMSLYFTSAVWASLALCLVYMVHR